MPPTAPQPEGFSDSDQAWFDRLSGKAGGQDESPAAREADALRTALDQEQARLRQAATAADDVTQARDWDRLEAALAQQGLLKAQPQTRWGWPALGGLAAAVLLSAVLLPWWASRDDPVYPEPPVLRGGPPVQRITTDAPRQTAERLTADLRQAGLSPGLFQQGDTFVVDLVLQPDQLAAATPALQPLGLSPTPGLTRLVFGPP